MIKISQEEFEAKIQDIIDGKTTRVKLLSELKTDKNTLNNRIQELVVYNPKLYKAFIQKFPYRPREYTHIDYEAIIIDILKNGYKKREIDEVYEGISSRTIQRKIDTVRIKNPRLVDLYTEVAEYKKKHMTIPPKLKEEIEKLESKEIFLCEICDNKREELLRQEKEYNEKLMSGKTVEQASKEVGRGRVSKAIDTLNRIEIERRVRSESIQEKGKGER